MKLQDAIALLGALAVFLYGMSTMTSGLEKLAGGGMARLLEKLTGNILMGVLLGAVVAGLVHSSAATTVMCIGFVNAGIMQLRQAVGVIMGANIGTTLTAQILRLGDISEDNVLLSLLRPETLGPALAFAGILLYAFWNGGRKKTVGQILLGLGLLFIGIESMETALTPLTELEAFRALFVRFSNPLLGIAVGALVTALIQSSTASVGILQAVAANGLVTFSSAIPIIMGQNIGTCITAIISSVGASRNAKRTAAVHLYFNLIGTALFLIVLYGANTLFGLPFWSDTVTRGDIANIHSVFNLSCTLVLLPFNRLLVRLVELTFPDDGQDTVVTMLDPRFLSTPQVALRRAYDVVVQMAQLARTNYRLAVGLFRDYSPKTLAQINENEQRLDHMEGSLDEYLVKLSSHSITPKDSDLVSDLIHALTNFERIGDYATNLTECAGQMNERGLHFSKEAARELELLSDAVGETLDTVTLAYEQHDKDAAFRVEPLEEVVDLICALLRERHVERVKTGGCSMEIGAQFMELLIHLERISDHCSNAAVRILRQFAPEGDPLIRVDPHNYLHQLHHSHQPLYDSLIDAAKERYYAPLLPA